MLKHSEITVCRKMTSSSISLLALPINHGWLYFFENFFENYFFSIILIFYMSSRGIMDNTLSRRPGNHSKSIPGSRPTFWKPKLKNWFKTINCWHYLVLFFSKTIFQTKKLSKSLNVVLIFNFLWRISFRILVGNAAAADVSR